MGASGTDIASTETPAPSRRPTLSATVPADPGFAALRRAARAAIVIPPVLAFTIFVLHGGQNVIFPVFGCFARLVMSDFGGQRSARAVAYLTGTAVGAWRLPLGTLVSLSAGLAAAVMFVVGLAIAFSRVVGGYLAAAQTGMLLSFVIAVSIPASASAIPARVGGWVMAGLISTLAGVVLWPRFERVMLRKQAAKACLAVAHLVETFRANDRELPRLIEAARHAERAAREAYTATAKRPAGPTRRDRAFVQLLTELQRVVDIIERPFHQPRVSERPCLAEGDHLAAVTVAALRGSADVLTGGASPDLRVLDEARDAHRAALDRWAAEQLRAGRPVDEVLDGLDVDHTLRVVGYIAIALGTNAVIAVGRQPDDTVSLPVTAPSLAGVRGTAIRVARTIRTHLEPTSPAGWEVGLVRIEDLAVGAAISVVVGLLLWPRGARRELARSVAGFYRAVTAYLDRAFDRVLGFSAPAGPDPARRSVIQAAERAGEAFDAFLNERSAPSLDAQTAGFLLAAGNHAILAGDLLDIISTRLGYQANGCPDGARSVRAEVRILLNGFSRLAHQLALEKAEGDIDPVSQRALRAAALDCLRRWRNDESAGRGAMAVVMAGEWAQNLARLQDDLREPVAHASDAARTP